MKQGGLTGEASPVNTPPKTAILISVVGLSLLLLAEPTPQRMLRRLVEYVVEVLIVAAIATLVKK